MQKGETIKTPTFSFDVLFFYTNNFFLICDLFFISLALVSVCFCLCDIKSCSFCHLLSIFHLLACLYACIFKTNNLSFAINVSTAILFFFFHSSQIMRVSGRSMKRAFA